MAIRAKRSPAATVALSDAQAAALCGPQARLPVHRCVTHSPDDPLFRGDSGEGLPKGLGLRQPGKGVSGPEYRRELPWRKVGKAGFGSCPG